MDSLLYGASETKFTQKFKPYIRCELCIHSEKRDIDPVDFIHCKKYPNMISHIDETCKSSELKGNKK